MSLNIKIYTTKGVYVKSANSVGKAAEITGADSGNVSRCVAGKANQTAGFVFVPGATTPITGIAIREYFQLPEMRVSDYIVKRTREIKSLSKSASK